MKNKILIFIFSIFFCSNIQTEEIYIEAKKITLDKDKVTTVFENDVKVTSKNKIITGEYARYNKAKGLLIIKENVTAIDSFNNTIKTEYAEYYENDQIFISKGLTQINTSENYKLKGEDIIADNYKKRIKSNKEFILTDQEGNKIYLNNFEYTASTNIFKSVIY